MTNPPPKHYPDGPYQPRHVVKAWGLGYNLGTVLKYICRAGKKGDAIEDLMKARDFLDFAIDELANDVLAKPPEEYNPGWIPGCLCTMCAVQKAEGMPCR